MKKLLIFGLLFLVVLSIPEPQRAEARIFGGGFRGGFRSFGFNRFNNGFYGGAFAGYNNLGFSGCYGGSFAYAQPVAFVQYVQPVAIVQLVPTITYAPQVSYQQAAYTPPVEIVQTVQAIPQFQTAYAAQSIYSTPLAFAGACYNNAGLFNANFGRYGLNHGAFFGGRRR